MTRELTQDQLDSFRSTLCEAATELFVEQGPDGVTLRALADRVGVSRSTPYRYFRNKDEILAAVQAAAFQRFANIAEGAYNSTVDPLERLQNISQMYFEFGLEHPDTYRIMFDFLQRGDYPELQREGARAREVLFKTTRDAVQSGHVKGDPNMIAHILWSTLHGVISLHLVGQLHWGPPVQELAKSTVEAVLRGIAA